MPLERELISIAKGGREVVKIKLQPPPEQPLAKAETKAFALLSRDGTPEAKFDTLADAIHVAKDGDTIEIRGNGPFVTEPIGTVDKSLTIRASVGFRPVIRLRAHDEAELPLLHVTRGNVILEGLELQRVDSKIFHGNVLVWCADKHDSIFAANCRFLTSGAAWQTCVNAFGSKCEFRNCEFICPRSVAVSTYSNSIKSATIDNCVHVGRHFVNTNCEGEAANEIAIGLAHNSVVSTENESGPSFMHLQLTKLPGDGKGSNKRINVQGKANIFSAKAAVKLSTGIPLVEDQENTIIPQLLGWRDQGNIYSIGGTSVNGGGGFRIILGNPADWKKYWGQPEGDLSEGNIKFKGGNLIARAVSEPDKISPEDFRLHPDSAGYQTGKNKKDLGADVDLVGPGAAYERWRNSPAYQQWLKDSGQAK